MPPKLVEADERWFLVIWLLISGWLLACALVLGGEYSDGYLTIANARFFFGDNPDYYLHRGPLAALALWPVELIRGALQSNAFDVRPYHFYSGVLHSLYLLGCWLLLKRSDHAFVPRIITFAAAILSVVFYAYAPFLSHDIIPGLLFLLLIFLCNRWLHEPTARTALQMVLLGAAVTFIKQTYAIFWIALCAYAALAWLFKWHNRSVSGRTFVTLFSLAAVSGALSWLGYGWATAVEIPEVALLQRPLVLITSVSVQYEIEGDIAALFPWDLYLRNLHNYGIAMVLSIIPGLVLALRGQDARLRMVAVCWLISAVAMQLIGFKEVRYLAFLAPLSAVLILPVVALAVRSRVLFPALLAVIVIDQYRGLSMAATQLSAAAATNITRFVGDLGNGKLIASPYSSFAYMADSPIQRDRYHGILHIASDQIFGLNEGNTLTGTLNDPRDLGVAGVAPGDRVIHSNTTVARQPPWGASNVPSTLQDLVMISGTAATVDLQRRDDRYVIEGYSGRYVMFIPRAESGKEMPLIAMNELAAEQVRAAYGSDVADRLQVLAVVVDTLCLADRCTYY